MLPDSVTSCQSGVPTTVSPASTPTTAIARVASVATTSTPNAFITTSRSRDTGEIISPRNVPCADSPAIASAAAMATASGSSRANAMLIAATGSTSPLPAIAPISPGADRSPTATPIAISTGISANTPSRTRVRGRRSTQRSSEPSSRPSGALRGTSADSSSVRVTRSPR